MNIKIPIKLFNENAKIPEKAHNRDAGFDMIATSKKVTDKYIQYGTGVGMDIPEGYVGLIFPRSSITKKDIMLKNSVGVIDSGYLGEISFRFGRQNYESQIYQIDIKNGDKTKPLDYLHDIKEKYDISDLDNIQYSSLSNQDEEIHKVYSEYEVGDRIGQIIFLNLPNTILVETDKLDDSERGEGSYGSSGN